MAMLLLVQFDLVGLVMKLLLWIFNETFMELFVCYCASNNDLSYSDNCNVKCFLFNAHSICIKFS
jgi:hypothetical protein